MGSRIHNAGVPSRPGPDAPSAQTTTRGDVPLFFWGSLLVLVGLALYFAGIAFSVVRIILRLDGPFRKWNETLLWYSGVPSTTGVVLAALDLIFLFPGKRKKSRRQQLEPLAGRRLAVALTAYEDEESIGSAVADFRSHPLVSHVIVVDNNSRDRTASVAQAAGAITFIESRPGYGSCVCRCFREALALDVDLIVLCEGDLTFRATDLEKLLAYIDHADIVNGTRIVEQLRDYATQLSTFIYYGNFLGGKLLEFKHLGCGTFTDLGTTYKILRRNSLQRLLPYLNPAVNLEFNAHLLDVALRQGERVVECPITFHPRVGASKGGNKSDFRALRVGLAMIWGLCFGWRRQV